MVERRPLIPRSQLNGGLVTEPHPALLSSTQSPDQENSLSLHGALRRRPGGNPLNISTGQGSGLKSQAISWHGAAVNDDLRDVPRRNWKGTGIIPYHEAYDWSDRFSQTPSIRSELRVRFVYQVGHKDCRGFNSYKADWDDAQYRRHLIGSGVTKEKIIPDAGIGGTDITTLGDIYIPDWVVYLLDGDDILTAGLTGGESYLAFSYNIAGIIRTVYLTKPVNEGDVIDITAQLVYNDLGNFVIGALYARWDDATTSSASQNHVGETEVVCSKRTIQVFGPYFPDYYWNHTPENNNAYQGDNFDWERRRMIPGEGVIEDIVIFKTNDVAVFDHSRWPTKTRIDEFKRTDFQQYILGHWPGWGWQDRQFIDSSAQGNHGYLVPGEPLILEEQGKLPGLLTDRVSEWVVKDFDYDTVDDTDQWQEGAMLRQFMEQSGRGTDVSVFRDPDGNVIVASLTIGATVTFHEGPQGDAELTPFVTVSKKQSGDAPHPLMNTPDFDCGTGFRICEIIGFNGASRQIQGIVYNTQGADTRLVIDGPETPIGRPVTAVLSYYIAKVVDGEVIDYSTSAKLFVNGKLVGSAVDLWADAGEQYWGPIAEVLSGRFHGEVHDIRMGVHDYPGDNETCTVVAVPDLPVTTAILDIDLAGAFPADSLLPIDATILHDGFRPAFSPLGAGSRQGLAVRMLGDQTESDDAGRQFVSGFNGESYVGTWDWQFNTFSPCHRAGRTNTVYSQSFREIHFSWIYAWWRAWPHRAGDIRTRKPRTPGRCWQQLMHIGVGGNDAWFGAKSDSGLADVLDAFGDALWVGSFSPYERYSALFPAPMSPIFSSPHAPYHGAPSRKLAPPDLGLKWGEGCRYPTDEDGAVGFIHQWKDGEGQEIFFGTGRNLYLWSPPWEDGGGSRLRVNGLSYWESSASSNLAIRNETDDYELTVAFWYTRKTVRAVGRVIATAHDSVGGGEAWSIYDHNGILCVTIGDATYSTYPSGLIGGIAPNENIVPDDLFSDCRRHWIVVLISGSAQESLIKLWWDGEQVELYKNGVPAAGIPLQNSTYTLRVGGGAPDLRTVVSPAGDTRELEMAMANGDCVIGAMLVGRTTAITGVPLIQINPPESVLALPVTGISHKVLFSEGVGQLAGSLVNSPVSDLFWKGRDIQLLHDNMPFLGLENEVPEVLQVEQDAVLVVGTGRARRWRRNLLAPSNEQWKVGHLGLPDPWESPAIDDVVGVAMVNFYDVGELDNAATYAVAISYYDEERDIRTNLVYGNAAVSPTNGILKIKSLPGLSWGEATHLEVWVSTGGPYYLARRLRGTDHEAVEIASVRYQDVVFTGACGEPPIARHIGLLSERLYLGNLPFISEQAVAISSAGLPWSFPASNVFQFGDSQDGVVTALHVSMGRVLVAQESLCTWFRPGVSIQDSTAEAVARAIGFRTRWGPVTWSGPLLGMTSRGPAVMDGVQFQWLGSQVQDQFQDSSMWWVAYDGTNHVWWFIANRDGEWSKAMLLTENQEGEVWSKLRLPAISCVGEIEFRGQRRLTLGTRLGRMMTMDGDGDLVHSSWEGSFSDIACSVMDVNWAILSAVWPGSHDLLRGQPFCGPVGESIIYGPLIDLHNGSTDIVGLVLSTTTDHVTGSLNDIGGLTAYWTTPWMDFGLVSRKKKIGQLWFAFSALAETLQVQFDSAMSAAVTRALERAFPASPAGEATIDMLNGYMTNPLQLGNVPGVNGIYFRFKLLTRSNRAAWEIWQYTIEGELSGVRAET